MLKLREDARYTQALVADQLNMFYSLPNVTGSDLARYETGTADPDSELLENFADLFGLTLETLLETDDPLGTDSPADIQVKGFIDAGSPSVGVESVNSVIYLQRNSPRAFEMTVSGSDLEIEGIKDGDRLFIDPVANLAIGKLFAISLGDRVIIRKLLTDDDGEVIVAANGPTEELKLGDPSIELLGRVVGIFHPI